MNMMRQTRSNNVARMCLIAENLLSWLLNKIKLFMELLIEQKRSKIIDIYLEFFFLPLEGCA